MNFRKTMSPSLCPSWTALSASLMLLASVASTGCQVEVGGQSLPSAYYQSDDIQYYPPGSEFKLAREAAAMKEQASGGDLESF